jgi:3-oxoacid CoA-transferase subunit A
MEVGLITRKRAVIYSQRSGGDGQMPATCGRVTVAEVEHLVGPGALEPDHVHTPSVFVQRLIVATRNEKRIEQRIVRKEVT